MKATLLFLLSPTLLLAEPSILKLGYKEGEAAKYPEQIQEAFSKQLATDAALAGEFAKFSPAPAEDGGTPNEPLVISVVLSETSHADFQAAGGTEEFKKTIALYYRFDERTRLSSSTTHGVFALFTVTGEATFLAPENGELEITKSNVTAKFEGFSRTLTATSPDE